MNNDIDNNIKDIMYDKTLICPVCEKKVLAKTLKTGHNKYLRSDTDLKSYYSLVDVNLYEVVHCSCGYTALKSGFEKLLTVQKKLIQENICSKFVETQRNEYRTINDAIQLYKLALLNSMTKNAKNGELGMICLRLAWLYRDKTDVANEMKFLTHAAEHLEKALETENFPIFSFEDEDTLIYVLADLNRRIGKEDKCSTLLSQVLLSKNATPRLKDRARDLKEMLKK